MSKHSQGVWKVRRRGDVINSFDVYGGYKSHVAYIGGYTVTEMQANARLIAEAPQMYELLKAIATNDDACTCAAVSWYGDGHASQCIQEMAGEIINRLQVKS